MVIKYLKFKNNGFIYYYFMKLSHGKYKLKKRPNMKSDRPAHQLSYIKQQEWNARSLARHLLFVRNCVQKLNTKS